MAWVMGLLMWVLLGALTLFAVLVALVLGAIASMISLGFKILMLIGALATLIWYSLWEFVQGKKSSHKDP